VVHDAIVLAAASFVFLGTVLRMWDSLADADRTGEFTPRSSREEIHRLRRVRLEEPADRSTARSVHPPGQWPHT
jgi:hypothetical protein